MIRPGRIVLATRNPGKLREFGRLVEAQGCECIGLQEGGIDGEPDETGGTFAENARLKAYAYSRHTDLPVLADDSGLEVFALGGRPGIHSARYAGIGARDQDRVARLLRELGTADSREARFVCALALAREGTLLLEAEGECRGVIAVEPRGSNGFGYDPVFLVPELGKTFAELAQEEKNRISHRARAVEALFREFRGQTT
ncbi:MAG: RdgB/HAM1 family non-canonical purine NTP pyrophosphatase [Acidobacteriota bacterium]